MADDVIGRYFAHPPTPSVSSDEPFVDASVDPCSHGERALEDNESAGRHDEGSSPRTRKIQSSSTTPVAGTRTASSIMQELSGKYLRVYRRRKRRKRQDLPPDPVEEFSSLGDTGGIYPADEVLELDCSCEEVLDDAPAAAPPPIMLHDQVAADSCGNMPSSWQRVAPRCAARRRRKSLEQLGAARFALWPSSSMTKNRSDDFSADYSPSSTSSADSLTRTVWRTSCTPESSANRSSSTLKRSRNRTTPRCPPDLRAEGTGWTRLWHCGLARKAPSDVTLVLKTGWDGLLSLQKNLVRCRRRKGDLPFFAKSQRHRRSENQFLDRTNRFSDEKMPPSSSDHRGPGQHLGRFLGVWLLLCVSFATTSPPEDAHPHLVRTTYKLTEPINAEVDGRKTAFTQVAEQPLASAPTAQHESSMKSTPQHAGVQARERRLHEKAATAPRRILDEASDNIVAQRIRRETAEYDRPKNAQASTTGGSHDSNGLLQRHFAHNADLFEQRKDGSIVQRHDGKEVAPPTEPKARERRDLEMGNRRALLASIDEKTGKIKDRDAHRKAANEIHRFNVAERRRLSAAGAVDPSGEVSDEALAEEGNQNAHGGANTRQLATASTEGSIIYPEFVKQEVCRGMDERRPGYYCGERWGITNIVKVEDQWKINELEFFWDAHCTNPVVGVSKQQSFSDETFSNEDTSALAFDGNNKTMYTANCRASLSGCPAFIPGVQGQRIDNEGRLNTVIYKQLVRDDEVPDLFGNVKLYDPAKTTVTQDGAIKCVRIFQSPITTEQAYRIGVVFWDTLQWVKYDEFDSLAGGGWQSRPAGSITIWKLTNGNPTASPWTVNELYFYGDRRCDYVLSGIPVGTENVRELPQCHEAGTCDDTSVEKIRDGDITTAFKARCSETEVSAPCSSNYAFIGYDYGYTPRTVLCIKIWQEAHAGYGQAWHVSQHSEALQLQSWDGRGWRVDKNLYNLLPNKWNYDYAPMNTLWRLTADVVIPEWRVAEIEFFNNPFCDTTDESGLVQVLPIQRVPLPGTAFDSNTVLALNDEQIACADSQILSSCSAKVFDGKIDTFWQGSCRPNEPCERESNYIGIFSDLPIDVQCFKIFQSQDPRYSVVTLHISTWDGNGGWQIPNPWSSLSSTISGIQNDLGGGSWNRRPAFQYSMWKFSNGVSTQLQWRVVDVHIYADIHCTERMDGIAWLASGSESMANSVVAASDGNNQTFWEAKCLGNTLGCDRFTAWLGVQRTYNRPEILESNVPQCLVVDQYRDAAFQSGDIRMETWNGIRWYDPKAEFTTASNDYKTYYAGIGGGTGQARPAFSGTQWRLRASDSVEIWWVLSLEFFEDSECKPEKEVLVDTRNNRAIGSGYATGQELAQYIQRNEPRLVRDWGPEAVDYAVTIEANEEYHLMNAFDKSEETSWIDIRDKSPDGSRMMSASKYPLWVGVDFGNAPTMSVNCIRIWQHPQHFARDMRLEYWDGVQWGQVDYGIDQKWNLEGFSGGSWQRWPAGFQTVYRIQNAVLVPESWEVDEFGFYDTVGCLGTPLSGDIIVSGFRNPYVGTRAVDGIVRSDMREPEGGGVVRYPDSFWRAGCSPCDPGTAYIGMDFGFERRQVKCMRIWQAPAIERQSPVIDLMYWNGRDKFVRDDDKRFFSIGGGSWNRRPAMSNSMFRLRWVETRPPGKRCDKGRQRSNQRSWGVAEVEFFSDDDCNSKIPLENNGREPQWPTSSGEVNTVIGNRARNMRATVVTGGYRQIEAQASVNYDYYALNAADGKLDTIWGADCRTAMNGEIDDAAMCSERDWVGFDFGAPKTVKCIKILQARSDLNQCCDPAARMAMDRWNGTDWVMTEWRHEPQDDGTRDAVRVRADFTNMGQCTPDNIERRGRRETESCMIPLSSITRTLGHPLCIKHEWCTEIGFRGDCCPTGGDHMSRCCCTYLKEMKIFVDEIDLEDRGDAYDKMDLEMVTIQWTKVLPFWFMILAIIWFVLVNLEEPDRESKYHIYWERHCLPLRLWFNTEGYAQRFLRKFTFEKSDKPQIKAAKFLSVMLAFFVLGGALIWIILAYVAASFVLYCYFMAVLVVKWCKSVYFPGHDHDEWRRHAITQVAINPDQSDVKYPTSLGLVKVFGSTLAFTFFFFFRWIFDLLLFQSIMFMLGFGDTNISAYMIVLQVPRISIPAFDDFIDTGTDLMNSILGVAPASYVEILFFLFNGIPRCKGPAVLFGSMNIMAICLVLIKILNYDFFGLFAAGRYAISTTKPSCQQALCLGWNMLMEAFIFVTAQCFLVAVQMFKDLAMPGSQNWMCPWDDGIVVFIALMLLYGLIISFLIIVILCANGHFYGQDYILGPLGRQLGMNFDRLDPDGTGPDGGMINLEVLFAVIPTTFGVWLDDWNVPAYLMVERAHVYAEELWTPHKCDCCGEIHVPYEDIIRAQSRNVSLCYQALPAGLLFGKLCEYMNFPPIYYEGKRMRCLLKVKHSRRLEYEFYGKLMNTWFPRISSLFSFGLYIQLIATILAMTEENYQTVAKNSFYAAFALCFVKSSFHIFARRFVLFLEGRSMEVFLKKNPRAKPPPSDEELKRKDKEKILGIQRHELPNLRILLGHLAHGIVIGSVYGGLAVSGQLISETAGLWVGMSIGLAGGWLPIYMYYLMENPDVPIFLVGSFKIGFAMVIALGAFFLADEAGYSFRFAQIMASTCFTLQALPAVVCFKKRTYDERGILSPSLLQPVLFTYRGIPNYLAIITAMFMTCIPAKMLVPKPLDGSEKERVIDGITTQGNYRDLAAEKDMLGYVLFALIIASYLTGIVAAFLVAEQLHKRPVVLAIASAYMMILALQPFMFILFALFIGVIFGLAVGGHIESREVQRIKGISLHDKIQVYGDLSHADSKAARVEIQKEQKRQAYAIQNAIDEQRPICLPGEMVTIDEFGDPTDPDYVAPLELPAIPSIAELVQQKLDGEEDIVKDLKMSQSRAAIQFAAGLKDLQSEEKPGDKVESMSSIGQVGSANPNRSLVAQKMNLEKIKSGEATGRVASPQLALTGGPGALPLEDGSPSGGGRKPDHALEVLLALEGRPGARLLNVPQLALPTIDQEGDIVAEEEEEEENTVDADDMKLEVTKSPDNQIVAAGGQDPADMEHGHDMVLRDNEPAQYTFDETVHQWYDPYTGYYYDDARQEWYLPQSSGGTGPSGSAGPPKATRASSLRSQAEHIQRMHDRKKGVRKPGGR